MHISPKVIKLALRIAGGFIASLAAVVPPNWGTLVALVGSNMITLSVNLPGTVDKWDFVAILNAAKMVIPENIELRMRSTPVPTPAPAPVKPTDGNV